MVRGGDDEMTSEGAASETVRGETETARGEMAGETARGGDGERGRRRDDEGGRGE